MVMEEWKQTKTEEFMRRRVQTAWPHDLLTALDTLFKYGNPWRKEAGK